MSPLRIAFFAHWEVDPVPDEERDIDWTTELFLTGSFTIFIAYWRTFEPVAVALIEVVIVGAAEAAANKRHTPTIIAAY